MAKQKEGGRDSFLASFVLQNMHTNHPMISTHSVESPPKITITLSGISTYGSDSYTAERLSPRQGVDNKSLHMEGDWRDYQGNIRVPDNDC